MIKNSYSAVGENGSSVNSIPPRVFDSNTGEQPELQFLDDNFPFAHLAADFYGQTFEFVSISVLGVQPRTAERDNSSNSRGEQPTENGASDNRVSVNHPVFRPAMATAANTAMAPMIPLKPLDVKAKNIEDEVERYHASWKRIVSFTGWDGTDEQKVDNWCYNLGDDAIKYLNKLVFVTGVDNRNDIEQWKTKLIAELQSTGEFSNSCCDFYSRDQKEDEDFEEYVTALRDLASKSCFGATTERMIRDRILMGVFEDDVKVAIRVAAANNKKITLDEVIAIAKVQDRAIKSVRAAGAQVDSVSAGEKKPRNKTGHDGHRRNNDSHRGGSRGRGGSTSRGHGRRMQRGDHMDYCKKCRFRKGKHVFGECPAKAGQN